MFLVDIAESDVDIAESVDDIDKDEDVDMDEIEDEGDGTAGAAVDVAADVAAGAEAAAKFSRLADIQGCWRISSMEILSAGRSLKHRRTRSWHSWVSLVRNLRSALQICSSCSKGMSPQTMSYRRMPKLQTVAGIP